MADVGCEHSKFQADVDVHRLTNNAGEVDGYMADVRIRCTECQQAFQFIGLKQGLDLHGATVSWDQTEARLAISPDGKPSTSAVRGFSIKVGA